MHWVIRIKILPKDHPRAYCAGDFNLERMVDPQAESLFKYSIDVVQDATNARYVMAKIITASIKPDKQTPRIIAVDAGESGNSFAIGVYSVVTENKKPDKADPLGLLQPRLDPTQQAKMDVGLRIDQVIEVAPIHDRKVNQTTPVHFPSMTALIMQLVEHFKIEVVLWDRWQSTGEIHRLREKGIRAEKYSCKYSDFVNLRNKLWGGRVKAPAPEKGLEGLKDFDISNPLFVVQNPWSHLYIQFATVRGVGQKVLKPESGEDDMFRMAVLANSILSDQSILTRLLTPGGPNALMTPKYGARVGPQALVVRYSQNGGIGSGGNSNGGSVGSGQVYMIPRTRR